MEQPGLSHCCHLSFLNCSARPGATKLDKSEVEDVRQVVSEALSDAIAIAGPSTYMDAKVNDVQKMFDTSFPYFTASLCNYHIPSVKGCQYVNLLSRQADDE